MRNESLEPIVHSLAPNTIMRRAAPQLPKGFRAPEFFREASGTSAKSILYIHLKASWLVLRQCQNEL
jgi:hypothetical protein